MNFYSKTSQMHNISNLFNFGIKHSTCFGRSLRLYLHTSTKIPLMPEAASSVTTWSAEQMMLEMVQDRIATGVTRVVWRAAVLQMEILPHYYFSWIVSFQKQRYTCEINKMAMIRDACFLTIYFHVPVRCHMLSVVPLLRLGPSDVMLTL